MPLKRGWVSSRTEAAQSALRRLLWAVGTNEKVDCRFQMLVNFHLHARHFDAATELTRMQIAFQQAEKLRGCPLYVTDLKVTRVDLMSQKTAKFTLQSLRSRLPEALRQLARISRARGEQSMQGDRLITGHQGKESPGDGQQAISQRAAGVDAE